MWRTCPLNNFSSSVASRLRIVRSLEPVPHVKYVQAKFVGVIDIIIVAILQIEGMASYLSASQSSIAKVAFPGYTQNTRPRDGDVSVRSRIQSRNPHCNLVLAGSPSFSGNHHLRGKPFPFCQRTWQPEVGNTITD